MEGLKDRIWIGVVEDNKDPRRMGRVKVRVMDIFDEIPLEAIPWATPFKDLNGNSFNIPDEGKVVSVVFENTIYTPEYIYAQHYNENLQEKLKKLSEKDYTSMKSLVFDDATQIYVNESEGLKIDHKYNNLNIKKDYIALNLKDNNCNLYLGDATADQQAILGNRWMNWFDGFISNLLGESGGPYLGNYGAPVIPNPAMIEVLLEYKRIRESFLSDHVKIVDDDQVSEVKSTKDLRIDIDQIGDTWKSTFTEHKPKQKGQENTPKEGVYNGGAPNEYQAPPTDGSSKSPIDTNAEPDIPPSSLEANEELSKIIETLERKNYKIFTRPYEPNIVGVRNKKNGSAVSNLFDEIMHYFFVDDNGNWVHKKYKITTVPGVGKKFKKTSRSGGKKNLPDQEQASKGVSALVPGQYINYWSIDLHQGKYYALKQVGKPLPVMRQKSTDYYDFSVPITNDAYGINMHRSMPYPITYKDPLEDPSSAEGNFVDNWSEGCQVFKAMNQYKDFMRNNYKFRDKWGENRFTYSLILDTDII